MMRQKPEKELNFICLQMKKLTNFRIKMDLIRNLPAISQIYKLDPNDGQENGGTKGTNATVETRSVSTGRACAVPGMVTVLLDVDIASSEMRCASPEVDIALVGMGCAPPRLDIVSCRMVCASWDVDTVSVGMVCVAPEMDSVAVGMLSATGEKG